MGSLATLTALLYALASPSAQPPTPPSDQIIVNGQKERAEIARFVSQLSPQQADIQLGKFLVPVCPGVVGLPNGQNELVEARMRTVAAAVGAPVARPGCIPDVIVIVARDKKAAIEDLERRRPWLLGEIAGADIRLLKTLPGPAAGWQVVGKTQSDGMPLNRVRFGGVRDVAASDTVLAKSFSVVGRLQQPTVPQFLVSVVLIEDRALDGVSTMQLADYATMRALAPISWRSSSTPSHSILNLFEPGKGLAEQPASVTWWDVALLKSLYDTSNSLPADIQRSAIAAAMQREIEKVPPEDR